MIKIANLLRCRLQIHICLPYKYDISIMFFRLYYTNKMMIVTADKFVEPIRADASRGSGIVRRGYRGPGTRRAEE